MFSEDFWKLSLGLGACVATYLYGKNKGVTDTTIKFQERDVIQDQQNQIKKLTDKLDGLEKQIIYEPSASSSSDE